VREFVNKSIKTSKELKVDNLRRSQDCI